MADEASRARQSVIDVGQRNRLEAMQGEVRRNNEQITTLRRENKELRSALQQSHRGQRSLNVEEHYVKEEELLNNKTAVLKRSLNAVKAKNAELLKEIENTVEVDNFTRQEGNAGLEENSAVATKIRALENRLDKCLIKHNEVTTIRRTYETLLERLQLEHGGFNTQVAATEQALQCADRELGELVAVWKAAAEARDTARSELAEMKAQLSAERTKQRKDLDERRAFIETKRQQLEKKNESILAQLTQQEERHGRVLHTAASNNTSRRRGHRSGANSATMLRPEDMEDLQHHKTAYLRLREVTLGANVADVIAKLQERGAQHGQLQTTSEALEAELQTLTSEKASLQAEWETVNHRAGHALVSARVMRAARDIDGNAEGAADGDDGAGAAGGVADDETAGAGIAGAAGGADAAATGSGSAAATVLLRITDENADYGLRADRRHARRLVLEEFRQHLHQQEDAVAEAHLAHDSLSQLLRAVDLGVHYLAEKLNIIATVANADPGSTNTSVMREEAAPSTQTVDLLRSCGARLQLMLEEVTKEELDAVARAIAQARFRVPGTNVRVDEVLEAQQQQGMGMNYQALAGNRGNRGSVMHSSAAGGAGAGAAAAATASRGGESGQATRSSPAADDYPENEIHDRKELKMMALATVEREQQKAKKRQLQQRRNKEEVA